MNIQLNRRRINIGIIAALVVVSIGMVVSYVVFSIAPAKAATPYFTAASPIQPDYSASVNAYTSSVDIDADDNVYFVGGFGSTIYKYSRDGQFQNKFDVIGEMSGNPDSPVNSNIRDISVGSNGSIYVALMNSRAGTYVATVEEYDSNGAHVRQLFTTPEQVNAIDTVDLTGLTADDQGRLFVVNTINKTISIIDTVTGQEVAEFGGVGVADGQFKDKISGIDAYNGEIYINDASAGRVQVFTSNGVFIRSFSTGGDPSSPYFFDMRTMKIGTDGLIRFGHITGVYTFNTQGVEQGDHYVIPKPSPNDFTNPAPHYVVSDSFGRVYMTQGAPADTKLLYRYDTVMVEAPQYMPTDVTTVSAHDTGARLSWSVDPRELHQESLTDYQFSIRSPNGAGTIASGTLAIADFSHYDIANLRPGTEYELRVATVGIGGVGPDAVYMFRTTGVPPESVVLDPNNRTLTVSGEGFLQDPSGIYAAFQRSLVTFNGQALRACSMGTSLELEELIELLSPSIPNVADNVTDTKPCYLVFTTPDEVALRDDQVIIMLDEDFDFSARGSVIMDGGQEFVFNDNSGPGGNTNPWVQVNGSNPTAGTLQLPKRLSFNGKATPGANITVTVRSDPVVCTAIADSNGNWSCTLPVDLPAGAHTVLVDVVNPDASIRQLGPYGINVAGNGIGGVIDSNTPLAPNTGIKELKALLVSARAAKSDKQRDAIVASVGVGVIVASIGGVVLYAVSVRKKCYSLQD